MDESWEAPHAIENSKRVYVRTGDAANPYDLADVDLIIELVRRREEPLHLRETLLARARRHASILVPQATTYAEISISPIYPRRAFCSLDQAWQFLYESRYRDGRFFPAETLRRILDGAGAIHNREYGEVSRYGLILGRQEMGTRRGQEAPDQGHYRILDFGDLFHLVLKMLVCAARFYSQFGYRGNVLVGAAVHNAANQMMQFLPADDFVSQNCRCYDDVAQGQQIVEAENLEERREEILNEVLSQICWSFWQGHGLFPADPLRNYVQRTLQNMGRL